MQTGRLDVGEALIGWATLAKDKGIAFARADPLGRRQELDDDFGLCQFLARLAWFLPFFEFASSDAEGRFAVDVLEAAVGSGGLPDPTSSTRSVDRG